MRQNQRQREQQQRVTYFVNQKNDQREQEEGPGSFKRPAIDSEHGPDVTIALVNKTPADHMRALVAQLEELEDKLRAGGGAKKIEKQHKDGKLTARERIAKLIDPGTPFLEIGLLIAHDQYDGQAP